MLDYFLKEFLCRYTISRTIRINSKFFFEGYERTRSILHSSIQAASKIIESLPQSSNYANSETSPLPSLPVHGQFARRFKGVRWIFSGNRDPSLSPLVMRRRDNEWRGRGFDRFIGVGKPLPALHPREGIKPSFPRENCPFPLPSFNRSRLNPRNYRGPMMMTTRHRSIFARWLEGPALEMDC